MSEIWRQTHSRRARSFSAGLDVGRVLCPDCHFYKACEYQTRLNLARNASMRSPLTPALPTPISPSSATRPIVFVHEDCRDLLRPTMRTAANRTSGIPGLHDLEQILEIAREAVQLAELGHKAKEAIAIRLHNSVEELIAT